MYNAMDDHPFQLGKGPAVIIPEKKNHLIDYARVRTQEPEIKETWCNTAVNFITRFFNFFKIVGSRLLHLHYQPLRAKLRPKSAEFGRKNSFVRWQSNLAIYFDLSTGF